MRYSLEQSLKMIRDLLSAPGLCAQAGHRAPRHQARQPADRAGRPRQAHRFRRRAHPGLGRGHPHAGQHGRHAQVHVARAGAGPEDRFAGRPVLGRRRAVPAAHRQAPVRRRQRLLHHPPDHRPHAARRQAPSTRACPRPSTRSWPGRWPRTASSALQRRAISRRPCSRRSAGPRTPPSCRRQTRPGSPTRRPPTRKGQAVARRDGELGDRRLHGDAGAGAGVLEGRQGLDGPRGTEGFLDKFPAGIYADLARRRLRRLAGANSTPDQTVLSGGNIPGIPTSQQDLEATRAHTATTPLLAARPTPSREDFASTVTEPAVTRSPAGDSAAADAPSEPPASWLPSPSLPLPAPVRKKKPSAVFAALGAVAVAGVAALFLMVKADPVPTVASPASAASSPAAAAAVEAPVVVVAAGGAARHRTGTASRHGVRAAPATGTRPPAGQPRPRSRRAAPAPAPENSRVAVSEPVPQRQEPRPVSTHATAVAQNAVETCKDKFFLLKELCLAEQCEKAGARNHALCAKRREEAGCARKARSATEAACRPLRPSDVDVVHLEAAARAGPRSSEAAFPSPS